jgi:hypothetical protein
MYKITVRSPDGFHLNFESEEMPTRHGDTIEFVDFHTKRKEEFWNWSYRISSPPSSKQ